MLNTEDFIKRLEFIMEHFGLSASSFADKVSVQRSSISHLLSGRNKPSLDFVMKILDFFPELNLYWLLDGSGTYLKSENEEITPNKIETTPAPFFENKKSEENIATSNKDDIPKNENLTSYTNLFSQKTLDKKLEKIVFFYSDGTFENYNPTDSK